MRPGRNLDQPSQRLLLIHLSNQEGPSEEDLIPLEYRDQSPAPIIDNQDEATELEFNENTCAVRA